jgi:hypothetical protein
MPISTYDIQNFDNIMAGMGDWFTARLLRLMAHADKSNLAKLGQVYPEEFVHFCKWKYGYVPKEYSRIPEINRVVNGFNIKWRDEFGKEYEYIYITSGKDF